MLEELDEFDEFVVDGGRVGDVEVGELPGQGELVDEGLEVSALEDAPFQLEGFQGPRSDEGREGT